jgi:hypothetical protein
MFDSSPATAPVCFNRQQAATVAAMSVSWLKLQDRRGTGAPRLRCGNRVRYPVTSFLEWLKAHSETQSQAV